MAAFSGREKKDLRDALADQSNSPSNLTEKLSDAVASSDAGSSVAALGATSDLVGVDGTGNNAAPLAGTEARLDAVEAKLDELLAALKAQG